MGHPKLKILVQDLSLGVRHFWIKVIYIILTISLYPFLTWCCPGMAHCFVKSGVNLVGPRSVNLPGAGAAILISGAGLGQDPLPQQRSEEAPSGWHLNGKPIPRPAVPPWISEHSSGRRTWRVSLLSFNFMGLPHLGELQDAPVRHWYHHVNSVTHLDEGSLCTMQNFNNHNNWFDLDLLFSNE